MFQNDTDCRFLIQQGHVRNPLLSYLTENIGYGIIVNPAYLPADRATQFFRQVHQAGGTALLDPLTFGMRYSEFHREAEMRAYPYFNLGVSPQTYRRSQNRTMFVRDVINCQAQLEADVLLAPSMWFDDVSDPWFEVNLDLAGTALTYARDNYPGVPFFVPIYMDGTDLKSEAVLLAVADHYTTIEADGFYLCLDPMREEAAPSRDAELLVSWMRLVNKFHRNQFFVIVGYLDSAALLMGAAGASGFGSGIYYSNRKFGLTQWVGRSTGIKRTAVKFYSPVLLNSLHVDGQLPGAFAAGLLDQVVGDAEHCEALTDGRTPSSARWTRSESQLSYVAACQRMASIMHGRSVDQRLRIARRRIARGLSAYRSLLGAGMQFDASSGPDHLTAYRTALDTFAASREF